MTIKEKLENEHEAYGYYEIVEDGWTVCSYRTEDIECYGNVSVFDDKGKEVFHTITSDAVVSDKLLKYFLEFYKNRNEKDS